MVRRIITARPCLPGRACPAVPGRGWDMVVPSMEVLAPVSWRAAAWAGGHTYEIARFGPAEAYQARLSVATIERDAPFTVLPGRQRWLVVLDPGAGLGLGGADRQGGDLLTFAGDAVMTATLGPGARAARVLNVIVADGVAVAARWVDARTATTMPIDAPCWLLLFAAAPCEVELSGGVTGPRRFELAADHTAVVVADPATSLTLRGTAAVITLPDHLTRAAPPVP